MSLHTLPKLSQVSLKSIKTGLFGLPDEPVESLEMQELSDEGIALVAWVMRVKWPFLRCWYLILLFLAVVFCVVN